MPSSPVMIVRLPCKRVGAGQDDILCSFRQKEVLRVAGPCLWEGSRWLGKRGGGCRGESVGVCQLVGIHYGVA